MGLTDDEKARIGRDYDIGVPRLPSTALTTEHITTMLTRLEDIQESTTGVPLLTDEDFVNELKAFLEEILSSHSLDEGINRIGTTSGVLKTVSATKTCEAEGAYIAGDVISETDTASKGTAWIFEKVARTKGASGYISGARIISETTALTARLVLYLFTDTPTCELDDNAANTAVIWADRGNYVGRIDFPALSEHGTGASETIASTSTYGNLPIPFTCGLNMNKLVGVLVTLDGFDQVDGKSIRIDLTTEQY